MIRKPKFGIEVEFYIVDKNGYPVLSSNETVRKDCSRINPELKIVNELSSFQIEINPGPWDLDDDGLRKGINELQCHYNILKEVVEIHGWNLCETLMPVNITQEIIDHPDFFSKESRFNASATYFKNRDDIVLQNTSSYLRFPGETIIGCINEIHMHIQLLDDYQTVALYNYLNFNGLELTKQFNEQIKLGSHLFINENSIKLFEKANGEWNKDKSVFRVGNLPIGLKNHTEYNRILETFEKIPLSLNTDLDLESTVYFWTRLRGNPDNLRVEFRPMEMGKNWVERVKYLYQIIKDFEENNVPTSKNTAVNIKRV